MLHKSSRIIILYLVYHICHVCEYIIRTTALKVDIYSNSEISCSLSDYFFLILNFFFGGGGRGRGKQASSYYIIKCLPV